ncbi:outer membrane beta-barrel family protein [Algoriphagus confluentis]|uniref:Outer membrane beta-barrel family protein n=1 Tax=Algoriphagus confluentis TaxID=1697556 RepID=A0ABQ6PLP0_9BACT|nr:outer membrane beta-barrel family protein [Algoriphagus confluentis]
MKVNLTYTNLRLVLTILLSNAACFISWAQSTGTISGTVKSGTIAVEFVNVYLTLESDSSQIVSGEITDSLGNFTLNNLPFASYTLNFQMVGYVKKQLPLSLSSARSLIDMGEIQMQEDDQLLSGVEVTAMREMIQKTEEGFVVSASDNLTQIGGTAADLLRNMPGVLVGSDGGITLRGKSPLTLINGRVSGITGVDRSAQLDRIPASSIDRIEIINNPSAKYDADAEGGVINIILKKNEDEGTNGALAVGAGVGDRYRLNFSTLLNHKTDKWNFGLAYDNWYTTRTRSVKGDRINYELADDYYLTQRRFDERLIFYQNAKVTVDHQINEKNSLSMEALFAFPGEDNSETLTNNSQTSEGNFSGRNLRHSNEIRRSRALDFSLRYSKRFDDPEKSLLFTLSNTFGNDRENTDISSQNLSEQDDPQSDIFLQRTHLYQKTNLFNLGGDYIQPLGSKGLLETGYKGIIRYLNADYERANQENGEFVIDSLNTNIFIFNEQIHAVYAQYSGFIGSEQQARWKYNVGLRAEQVWNTGETPDGSTDFRNDYFNLFPSASISFFTPKQNSLKLSYGRRINRPGLGQLSPFTDITDSLNQRSGNPYLKPELIHSMDLTYDYNISRLSLSLSSFYRIRNNAIFPFTTLDENGVAFTQPMNFGNARTYGAELIATYSPFPFWNLNFSFSAFEQLIEENESTVELLVQQTSWYSKLINNFSLSPTSKLQLIANYTSPTAIPQGESVAVYFIDLGFQQNIWKGKGRLGLTVTDIFDTQEYGFITSDDNFDFSRVFKLDTRAVMLTLGYTFGGSFREKLMENRFRND